MTIKQLIRGQADLYITYLGGRFVTYMDIYYI